MTDATFTPKQAAHMAGVSAASLRNYTARYADHFSANATPPKGQPRKFTAEDVRLLAFIRDATARGLKHGQVQDAIEAGELGEFDHWQAPEPETEPIQDDEPSTALATGAQVQALQMILDDLQRRESVAKEETARLRTEMQAHDETYQERINSLTMQLGEAKGKLSAFEEAARNRRPEWFRRIFGG